MTESTERLVERACAGDRVALEALVERNLPGLRAFVRLRAGAEMRAREGESDIVQSTCREILEHADGFVYPGEAGFRKWLYTTALRKVLNKTEFHRAAKRDVRREQKPADTRGDEALLGCYKTIATPSQAAVAREELERIEAAVEQLPEDYREVLVLSRIVGFSRSEVAEQMNRSESAVSNLLHRALAQLARLLERSPSDS